MQKSNLLQKIEAIKSKEKVKYQINPAKCKGCDLCKKNCPAGAIEGNFREPHKINNNLCLSCGSCESVCPFKAVSCVNP